MDTVKIADELLIPAGRHTLAPEEVSARQRERLLRAMGQCVSERGYVETTIADVVRVARTSRTVFYRHFADKEECFLETYKQMTEVRIGASLQAAAGVPSGTGSSTSASPRTSAGWPSTPRSRHDRRGGAPAGRRALAGAQPGAAGLDANDRGRGGAGARRPGVEVELDEAAYIAIMSRPRPTCTSTPCAGASSESIEKAPDVQALARLLFAAPQADAKTTVAAPEGTATRCSPTRVLTLLPGYAAPTPGLRRGASASAAARPATASLR